MQIALGALDIARLTYLKDSMDCGLALGNGDGKVGCFKDCGDSGVVLSGRR